MLALGSLCSGMGALDRALSAHLGGARFAWHAETDPAAAHVLKVHHPTVPNVGSIITADWSVVEGVDALAMGVPCQPTSAAGRQLGDRDPRWLWPDARRAIAQLAPQTIGFENVANLVPFEKGRLWYGILDDLRALGYDVAWGVFGACLVGAPHHRHRVFALARKSLSPAPETRKWGGKACGVPIRRGRSATLLATPTARDGDGRGEGDGSYWDTRSARTGRTNGVPLAAQLITELLPTPSASTYGSHQGGAAGRVGPVRHSLDSMARLDLLPTPRAVDSSGGRLDYRDRPNGTSLPQAVSELLPTPVASDARGTRNATAGRSEGAQFNSGWTLGDVVFAGLMPTPRATDGTNGGSAGDLAMGSAVHFGRYAGAVARWEAVFGPVPEPTELGPRGGRRLAAPFAEWMMGIAPGYVTAHVERSDALRIIGNGVHALSAYYAFGELRKLLG